MSEVPGELAGSSGRPPERIGPYRIRGVLGRGGMGIVFDAEAADGQPVALKIVKPVGEVDNPGPTLARFEREARILGGLNHPSVVRLIDAGEADGMLYLAMERIDGVSLLAVRRRGALDLEPLVNIGFQLADALAHVHDAGVVHRDIKPANVLVRTDGRPVITDFGISGLAQATGITRQGDLLGSPGFMAPEIVAGRPPTPASDQFALGRLLFELGARGPAPKLPTGIPILEVLKRALEVDWTRFPTDDRWPELARILDRTLEAEPEDRFATLALVRTALASVLDDALAPETVSAHVEGLDLRSNHGWTVDAAAPDILADLDRPAGVRVHDPAEGPVTPLPVLPAEALEPQPEREHAPTLASGVGPEGDEEPTAAIPVHPGRPRLKLPSVGRAAKAEIPAPNLESPPALVDPTEPAPAPAPPPPEPSLAAQPVASIAASPRRSGELASSPYAAQVRRLQQQLDEARRRPAPKKNVVPLIAAGLGALLLGVGLGRWSAPGDPAPIALTLLPAGPPLEAKPPVAADPSEAPSPQDLKYARNLLVLAHEQIEAKNLDGAEDSLATCVDVANLPDCHRLRGTVRALVGDPSAHDSFRRYLELAPPSPEIDRLRKMLAP